MKAIAYVNFNTLVRENLDVAKCACMVGEWFAHPLIWECASAMRMHGFMVLGGRSIVGYEVGCEAASVNFDVIEVLC